MQILIVKILHPYKMILNENDVKAGLVNWFKKHRFTVVKIKTMPVKNAAVKKKKTVIYRSAITGKLITKEKALKNPETTVKETISSCLKKIEKPKKK